MSLDQALERELEALHAATAVVDRSDRGFVVVSGPDAVSFLQALVSADLDAVADGEGIHSLLLSPQGKLDVDFRLLRVGDALWLDCDPGFGGQLATSLERFKIRVDADVVDRSAEYAMLSVVGGDAADLPGVHAHRSGLGDGRVVRTRHGYDVVGPVGDVRLTAAGITPIPVAVSPIAYEAWRIEQGIPVQPFDLDGSTIPQEAFLERDAVSFTKGCFLGQELVCRIDSRGHVNRFLRRVNDIEGDWPVRGAEVLVDGKVVGTLTSVAPAALPTGALGYVRREVELPTRVELRSPDGAAQATVVAIDGTDSAND
jgi:folate-binding protein YgfZ